MVREQRHQESVSTRSDMSRSTRHPWRIQRRARNSKFAECEHATDASGLRIELVRCARGVPSGSQLEELRPVAL